MKLIVYLIISEVWSNGWKPCKPKAWLGLCCLTPLSTIFQLYRGGRFY
jgi:hypothetical protein